MAVRIRNPRKPRAAIARLVPNTTGIDRAKAAQAVANILARRVGVKLGDLEISGLVNEGRR